MPSNKPQPLKPTFFFIHYTHTSSYNFTCKQFIQDHTAFCGLFTDIVTIYLYSDGWYVKMSMKHWLNDTDKEKSKYLKENLNQYHFIYQKSHMKLLNNHHMFFQIIITQV